MNIKVHKQLLFSKSCRIYDLLYGYKTSKFCYAVNGSYQFVRNGIK